MLAASVLRIALRCWLGCRFVEVASIAAAGGASCVELKDRRIAGGFDSWHLRIYEKKPGGERVFRIEVDWECALAGA